MKLIEICPGLIVSFEDIVAVERELAGVVAGEQTVIHMRNGTKFLLNIDYKNVSCKIFSWQEKANE